MGTTFVVFVMSQDLLVEIHAAGQEEWRMDTGEAFEECGQPSSHQEEIKCIDVL